MVEKLLKRTDQKTVQKTFTSTSKYSKFDETEYAREVIRATKVEPSFVNPSPEKLLKDMKKLTWHNDEPFVSTSIFAGWCIFELARSQGITVTMDGQGPDEMMGGYVPYMYPSILAQSLLNRRMREFIGNLLGLKKPRIPIFNHAIRCC